MNRSNIVVLISGNGSNLQAIIDACKAGKIQAEISAVLSDREDAYGLVRARKHGIHTIYLKKFKTELREEYDSKLAVYVNNYELDYIVLAGWMKILSSAFLEKFKDKVINLHPALPGQFPGTHAIERAYKAYQKGEIKYTGVMVHFVPDEGVDNGPLLASEIVKIYPTDTLESLEERIHETEHSILVRTLKTLCKQRPEN